MKSNKIIKMRSAMLAALVLGAAANAETFTTCGATGALGPDQAACDTAYLGTDLEGAVTVSGGIQQWTVPATGTYQIQVIGAQGAAADATYSGGLGAELTGEFELTAGDILQIVVGQQGIGAGSGSNGGGGGGSFVVDNADQPMIIAGGGGGTREYVLQNGCNASLTQYGIIGSGSSQTSACTVKAGDLGLGGIVSSSSWGSGGGGFNGDGAADSSYGDGGSSWANGIVGGEPLSGFLAYGGFGAGGTGNGSLGGGGGGGYSGGDGGRVAGGGGSFNAGASPTAVITAATGDGSVVITALDVPSVSVPLSNQSKGLLALLFATASFAFFRRRRIA